MIFLEEKAFDIKLQYEIKRKIQILELISIENRWYTQEEIAQVVKASTKTIGKDVTVLKECVPQNWDVKIKKGYGVFLCMPKNASIAEVVCKLFRKTFTFKMLDLLLKYKCLTAKNIADELYIQPYMVTRALKKIEQDITYFGLQLKRKPLEIVGDDLAIIYMFTELYSKAYVGSDWPFKHNQTIILEFIERLESSMEIVLDLSSRRKFSYFIGIFLMRIKKEKNYVLSSMISNMDIETDFYEKISMLLETVTQQYHITFSVPEKVMFTIVYKSLNFTFKNPIQEQKKELQIFQEGKVKNYNLVKDFICMLDSRLGLQLIKDDQFIYSLINYFRQKVFVLHYCHVKQTNEASTNYVKEKYLESFFQVEDIYNTWARKHEIANFIPEREIANIVLQIKAYQIRNKVSVKKIMIITKEGDSWKSYLSAILKDKFGSKIEIIKYTSLNVERGYELETEFNIDIIVSTIPVRVYLCPVVQIQPNVTERDLDNIKHYLNV
ncbi:helix-turn-helix domain-containing protein [Bacillus thuringiensis]|uniref:helix-turn-helix domain-containing protein n=1 Tax=Bacillus thuringiensis TaxID=1428 RepID=UPI000CD9B8AC|nr:helix-turn-helix domain-containing protein [Bacillus thuringiensis]